MTDLDPLIFENASLAEKARLRKAFSELDALRHILKRLDDLERASAESNTMKESE